MDSKILAMESLVRHPQTWPVSVQAILGAVILGIVYSFLTGDRPYPGLPVAKIEEKGVKSLIQVVLPAFSWMLSPREVLAKGKEISKVSDGIYQVRASGGYKIVLPRYEICRTKSHSYLCETLADFASFWM